MTRGATISVTLISTILLAFGLVLTTPHAQASGEAADGMCSPYYVLCPCNLVPNPDKNSMQKCINSTIVNLQGYSNTHACAPGVCKDTTNGKVTIGQCTGSYQCDATQTNGQKPAQTTPQQEQAATPQSQPSQPSSGNTSGGSSGATTQATSPEGTPPQGQSPTTPESQTGSTPSLTPTAPSSVLDSAFQQLENIMGGQAPIPSVDQSLPPDTGANSGQPSWLQDAQVGLQPTNIGQPSGSADNGSGPTSALEPVGGPSFQSSLSQPMGGLNGLTNVGDENTLSDTDKAAQDVAAIRDTIANDAGKFGSWVDSTLFAAQPPASVPTTNQGVSAQALQDAAQAFGADRGYSPSQINTVAQGLGGVAQQESDFNANTACNGGGYCGLGQLASTETNLHSNETDSSLTTLQMLSTSPNLSAAQQDQVQGVVQAIQEMQANGVNPNLDPEAGAWLLAARQANLAEYGPDASPMDAAATYAQTPQQAAAMMEAAQLAPSMFVNGYNPDQLLTNTNTGPAYQLSGGEVAAFDKNSVPVSAGQTDGQAIALMASGSVYAGHFDQGISLMQSTSGSLPAVSWGSDTAGLPPSTVSYASLDPTGGVASFPTYASTEASIASTYDAMQSINNAEFNNATGIAQTSPQDISSQTPNIVTAAYGDSVANGLIQQGGLDGVAKDSQNPQWVLNAINNDNTDLTDQGVILSTGCSNNTSMCSANDYQVVKDQISSLEANGASPSDIRILAVGPTAAPASVVNDINSNLQSIAEQAGAQFIPQSDIAWNGYHPSDYSAVLDTANSIGPSVAASGPAVLEPAITEPTPAENFAATFDSTQPAITSQQWEDISMSEQQAAVQATIGNENGGQGIIQPEQSPPTVAENTNPTSLQPIGPTTGSEPTLSGGVFPQLNPTSVTTQLFTSEQTLTSGGEGGGVSSGPLADLTPQERIDAAFSGFSGTVEPNAAPFPTAEVSTQPLPPITQPSSGEGNAESQPVSQSGTPVAVASQPAEAGPQAPAETISAENQKAPELPSWMEPIAAGYQAGIASLQQDYQALVAQFGQPTSEVANQTTPTSQQSVLDTLVNGYGSEGPFSGDWQGLENTGTVTGVANQTTPTSVDVTGEAIANATLPSGQTQPVELTHEGLDAAFQAFTQPPAFAFNNPYAPSTLPTAGADAFAGPTAGAPSFAQTPSWANTVTDMPNVPTAVQNDYQALANEFGQPSQPVATALNGANTGVSTGEAIANATEPNGTQVAQNPDLTPLTPPSSSDQLGRNYYENGDVSPQVQSLQKDLNNLGYPVGSALTCSGSSCAGAPGQETDTFGPATTRAVEQFQADNGLPVDGKVGPDTMAAINSQIDAQPIAAAPTESASTNADNNSPTDETAANTTEPSGEAAPTNASQERLDAAFQVFTQSPAASDNVPAEQGLTFEQRVDANFFTQPAVSLEDMVTAAEQPQGPVGTTPTPLDQLVSPQAFSITSEAAQNMALQGAATTLDNQFWDNLAQASENNQAISAQQGIDQALQNEMNAIAAGAEADQNTASEHLTNDELNAIAAGTEADQNTASQPNSADQLQKAQADLQKQQDQALADMQPEKSGTAVNPNSPAPIVPQTPPPLTPQQQQAQALKNQINGLSSAVRNFVANPTPEGLSSLVARARSVAAQGGAFANSEIQGLAAQLGGFSRAAGYPVTLVAGGISSNMASINGNINQAVGILNRVINGK